MRGLCSLQFSPYATHPMLLPTLILNSWCDFNDFKLDRSHERLDEVRRATSSIQEAIEVISKYLSLPEKKVDKMQKKIQDDCTRINKILLQEHEFLLNDSFPFLHRLGHSCLKGLKECKSLLISNPENLSSRLTDVFTPAERELNGFLDFLQNALAAYDQRRKSLVTLRTQVPITPQYLLTLLTV